MRRRLLLLATCGVAALVVSLTVPAFFLSAAQYGALAAGVQAFGVVAALAFGAATLARESRDKRVDRVIAAFDSYQVGHLDVKYRLSEHLRGKDGLLRPVTYSQLRHDPTLLAYPNAREFEPRIDAERLLRFFEALNGMRCAGALDLPLTHRLLGRNALFWDYLISFDPSDNWRQPLRDLAEWVQAYCGEYRPAYAGEWRESFRGYFGPGSPDLVETTPTSRDESVGSGSQPPRRPDRAADRGRDN